MRKLKDLRCRLASTALTVIFVVACGLGVTVPASAADCASEAAQLNSVQAQIGEHNAKPHVFYIPEQQAEYDAYNAEASELDSAQQAALDELDACQSGGTTDTEGPGHWGKGKNNGSERAQLYEEQVTGHPVTESYYIDDVEFDGYEDGILQDAKGLGYWGLLTKPWSRALPKLLDDANRQLAVAGDTPIEWHFAEREAADFMRLLLPRIKVVYTPPDW